MKKTNYKISLPKITKLKRNDQTRVISLYYIVHSLIESIIEDINTRFENHSQNILNLIFGHGIPNNGLNLSAEQIWLSPCNIWGNFKPMLSIKNIKVYQLKREMQI